VDDAEQVAVGEAAFADRGDVARNADRLQQTAFEYMPLNFSELRVALKSNRKGKAQR
jgi:hypothetical protein